MSDDLEDSLEPERAIEDMIHEIRLCIPVILDEGSHTQRMRLVKGFRLMTALAQEIREEVIHHDSP